MSPSPTPNPPGVTLGEVLPNGPLVPGANALVLTGGGTAAEVAAAVQAKAPQPLLALWYLEGGVWRYYLPSLPAVSTLTRIDQPLAALYAVLSSPAAATPSPAPPSTAPASVVYTVQPGESLWTIAARFGTTVEELQRLNGITNPNQVFAGTTLVVPASPSSPAAPPPTPSPSPRSTPAGTVTYTVQPGESLWIIAGRFGTTVEELQRLNGITNPSQVFAGTTLIVPASR